MCVQKHQLFLGVITFITNLTVNLAIFFQGVFYAAHDSFAKFVYNYECMHIVSLALVWSAGLEDVESLDHYWNM